MDPSDDPPPPASGMPSSEAVAATRAAVMAEQARWHPSRPDRPFVDNPHPEVVRWDDTAGLGLWPTEKTFPFTPLEAWYLLQGYTIAPVGGFFTEDLFDLPGLPGRYEGGGGGIGGSIHVRR